MISTNLRCHTKLAAYWGFMKIDLDAVYKNVLKMSEFIFEQFFESCLDDENPMKVFARTLINRLLDTLLKQGILPRLPTDFKDVECFVQCASRVQDLEAQLIDWGNFN